MKVKFITVALMVLLFSSCYNKNTLKLMQELEEGVSRPTSIEELKDAIKKYQRRVDDIMIAENRIAIWYKMLGTRYMENKMFGKALTAFQAALAYYPNNQNLYYYVGVCASNIAKGSLDFDLNGSEETKKQYYDLAISAYKRALEIEPTYRNAAYALSVIYVYEIQEPEKAIELLEPIIQTETKPFEVMFVLAASYYLTEQYDLAIDMYQNIIEKSSSEIQLEEAKNNIQLIKEIMEK